MRKKKIVLIVDNPLRDLPACSLVAAELSPEFDVSLVSMSQAPTEIFRHAPDLVILNYLRVTNTPLARKLVACGIPFSILGTEDGVFLNIPGTNENSYTKVLIQDQELRYKVEQYFVWGEALFQYLQSHLIYRDETLQCLGTPRTDFYSARFKEYFQDSQDVPSGRPMVLINTSFPINNPKFATREEEIENAIRIFGYSRDFIENLANQQDIILKEYISLVHFLSGRFPQVDFLLRPHPFEKLDVYQQALSNCSNVRVEVRDTVAKWIWKSTLMLHYESSTAIESAFSGRPAISLAQYKDVRPNQSIESITIYAQSFEHVASLIEAHLRGENIISPEVQENLKKIERDVYYRVDGQSYLRIANSIRSWFANHTTSQSPAQKTKAFGYFLFYGARSLLKLLAKGRLVPEAKRFSPEQVSEVIHKLSPIIRKEPRVSQKFLSTAVDIQY